MATERSDDETRRRELAGFLRKKRERLPPPRGVTSHQRRLTPGLRREEVAELAGVGTTWYTWLEQARDIRPSERTIRRIARALKLSKLETRYLLEIALEHAPRPADEHVPREIVMVVKAITTPAFLLGRTADLIMYNLPANAVFDFDYVPERNYFGTLFSVEWRALIENWSAYAMHMLAVFRRRSARLLGEPDVAGFITHQSRRSPEFSRWWAEHALTESHSFTAICNHPFVGRLELDVVCFSVVEHPDFAVVGLVTEQAETVQRIEELVRQFKAGEHDAAHNLWTALLPSVSPAGDYHSDYQ